MTVHLVTFASDDMSESGMTCMTSAMRHGVGNASQQCPQSVRDLPFYPNAQQLLAQPRGRGYWAWKPAIILNALMNPEHSLVIYADAGIEFINNVSHIIDRMDQDVFLFGNMYEHAHWCKRDIVEALFPPESAVYMSKKNWSEFGKQVQASVIFFRVSDYARAFVKEWLDWCLFDGGRLIDDSPSSAPNHPEFQENRHDQAILTTLAYREGIKLHWWPAVYNDGAFTYEKGEYTDDYPPLFHHHRKRNSEWTAAA